MNCSPREIEYIASQAYGFAYTLLQPDSFDVERPHNELSHDNSVKDDFQMVHADCDKAEMQNDDHGALGWLDLTIALLKRDGGIGDLSYSPKNGFQTRLRVIHVRRGKEKRMGNFR